MTTRTTTHQTAIAPEVQLELHFAPQLTGCTESTTSTILDLLAQQLIVQQPPNLNRQMEALLESLQSAVDNQDDHRAKRMLHSIICANLSSAEVASLFPSIKRMEHQRSSAHARYVGIGVLPDSSNSQYMVPTVFYRTPTTKR